MIWLVLWVINLLLIVCNIAEGATATIVFPIVALFCYTMVIILKGE